MASNWGHVLQAAANGYIRGKGLADASEKAESDKQWEQEQRAEVRAERSEKKSLRADLREAAMPVTVAEGANNAVLPQTMDNRDVGQAGEAPIVAAGAYRVAGQTVATPEAAQTIATAANDPMAVAGRQAGVYASRGMPAEAAALENRQMSLQKHAAELKELGFDRALKDARAGNPGGFAAAAKATGFNVVGTPTVKPTRVDVPGLGPIDTYEATFDYKDTDGSVKSYTANAHQVTMAAQPYLKQMEFMSKAGERADKAEDRKDRMADRVQRTQQQEVMNQSLVALRQAQQTRIEQRGASGGGSGGDDKSDREYRLRLQGLSGGIQTEIRETDHLIKDAMKDALPGQPMPAHVAQMVKDRVGLVAQRDAIKQEALSLAEKKRPGSENLAALKKPTTEKTPQGEAVVVKDKAGYDRLPPGALYVHPDGTTKRKGK